MHVHEDADILSICCTVSLSPCLTDLSITAYVPATFVNQWLERAAVEKLLEVNPGGFPMH